MNQSIMQFMNQVGDQSINITMYESINQAVDEPINITIDEAVKKLIRHLMNHPGCHTTIFRSHNFC